MSKWQPISTAPKDTEVEILVYGGDGYFIAIWDHISECFAEASTGDVLRGKEVGDWCAPTDWQPLPKPPKPPKFRPVTSTIGTGK